MLWGAGAVVLVLALSGVGLIAARAGGAAGPRGAKAKKGPETPPASPVELTAVRRGAITTYLLGTAALEPRYSATLLAERAGRVTELLVEEGAWVRRGQVLARLDDRDARLAVQRTELAADAAARDAERGRQMREQGFLSQREVESLEVRRRETWVALEQARLDLARTEITSPFAGRVVARSVNLGETATVGRECFRVVDFDPVLARVHFAERDLGRVRAGQRAWILSDSGPAGGVAGRVTLVNPVVDEAHGTFKVTVEATNAGGVLRPGAFARVRIESERVADALLMPRRGLLEEDGEQFVFVARGDSAVRVPVRIGAAAHDTVQVVAGLVAGDRVVTLGQGGLRPGARIRPVRL
jgi:membrane fusion protein (multidrug efflux system)